MDDAPPTYTTGDSPPSYDEVAKKLEGLVGDDVTPDRVLDATDKLSDAEIDILINGADGHWPLETDQQKTDFAVGCGQCLSSPEGKTRFASAGDEATQATRDIENIFVSLHLRIAQIDRIHHSAFEPEIINLQQAYRDVLAGSRDFAATVSVQSKRFDESILKICANESIAIQTRRNTLETYIEGTTAFQSDAQRITDGFRTVTEDFAAFVASFSTWAKDKEGEITEQIRLVEQELDALHQKLYQLESSLRAFEIVFGASIPATGTFVKMFPALAPWILGGVITALASFAAIAGLAAGISKTNYRIHLKTQEKEKLQTELENLRRTRAQLEDFGHDSLTRFETAVGILTGAWEQTLADARIVQDWLVRGANVTHRPEYVELNIRHGVSKYSALSEYLESYARGI
ncbi:uncharacterized protein BO95DRAFT_490188 [Aspergillus brunneoviolaceus CBS 621.78]|uniref:Uncharacterized protein n=1 Tax=Aspergillus brunneoviolaceus CBS 621.78 TaxID=1450534 RepID=A0ACD1GHI1_9EURO|nr:hypothetical protein BO95DRAFT_490188 [Aspergillus brunneoviolaceus CBS 621.78]RAH48744.1 hypothetical protein BO95DRAFT_490188 [Aspergillus brunneoviolaceus CBS 621.78]